MRVPRLPAVLLAVLAAAPAGAAPTRCQAPLPAELSPPGKAALAFELAAEGVQIYACEAGAAGPAWTLKAPEAALTDAGGKPAGKHAAGPTWTASDGSGVQGAKVAAATPDPGAIPWLLLRVASRQGTGRMDRVAWVQRVATRGGLAPTAGCDAAHLGATVRVPYTAAYCFLADE